MPIRPGSPDTTYRAALVRAAALLGGAVPLCHRLRVPMADLTRWLAGNGKPPMGIFLRVIDILLEESRKRAVPPPPRAQKPLKPQK
jgi:hypothetical protein